MSDFKIYKNNSESAGNYPFIIDVQSPLLSSLETRLAMPLIDSTLFTGKTIRNLNPAVTIAETKYVVLTQQMAAIPRAMLGDLVDAAEVDRSQILSSIDFLITGI